MPTQVRRKPAPVAIPPTVPQVLVPAAGVARVRLGTGNVKVRPPWNGTWQVPWDRLKPFVPAVEREANTHLLDPNVLSGIGLVESQWRQFDANGAVIMGPDDGFGDGRPIGWGQVKPKVWGAKAAELGYDLKTTDGNIGMAAWIMADAIRRRGSWQKALAMDYHPGTNPANGVSPESYIRTVEGFLAETQATTPDDDPWRPYPYPPMRKDAHVRKAFDGAGFDRVAHRGPRIVGSCNHITDGVPYPDGSGDQVIWYRDFFSIGGERANDALTDTVIADNGDIGLLNDWRDPDWGGRRAGWANGTSGGLEGDGIAFYRHYPDINSLLVSKEHVTRTGRPITASCLEASIELSTAVAQEVRCPWDKYPYHPGKHGVNIEQQHRNFATKACPAEPFISTTYPKLIAEVRARLKAHQGGEPSVPTPEPTDTFTKWGMTAQHLAWFFGAFVRVNTDGTTEELPFSPTGPLSLLWMKRCEEEAVFPEADLIQTWDSEIAEGKESYAVWKNGWVAWLPIDNSRAGWRWLDKEN